MRKTASIMCWGILWSLLGAFIPATTGAKTTDGDTTIYRVVGEEYINDTRYSLGREIVELAFQKSKKKYPEKYEIRVSVARHFQGDNFRQIGLGKFPDIIWSMTSKEREKMARAVYFPLYKGLLGKRIHVVSESNKDLFANLTAADAKKLTYCIGSDWPDRDIYYQNGFTNLVENSEYLGLQRKIKSQSHFCDAFTRGAHEVIMEYFQTFTTRYEQPVIPDQHVLFNYDAPSFFFVNHKEKELADRILYGLKQAMQDGSFNELFYNHPTVVTMIDYGRLQERREIPLQSDLSLKSRALYNQKQFWFSWEEVKTYRRPDNVVQIPDFLKQNSYFSMTETASE